MTSFILRVVAYHGEPKLINNVPTRDSVHCDTPFIAAQIVNDPEHPASVVEVTTEHSTTGSSSSYTLDQLIDDFEDEYECKVNLEEPEQIVFKSRSSISDQTETVIHEFNIFEPAWPSKEEAEDVIGDLKIRLEDWIEGYPTGR